ncbi:hydrolase [Neptunomonas sp.]|uniref:hydrolase n=1 Tax=Neptunomonas sp. TaxID=1971898 RepID=UPI0025DAB23D|nr:hydrolase [Neptunomonas sp.]
MLIHPQKSCLLVVDIQEKLAPAIHEKEMLIQNSKWLIEIANILNITIMTSEQYPQGIGRTIDELKEILPKDQYMEKTHFSCMSEPTCHKKVHDSNLEQMVIIGMESHVCVMQTAIQLKQQGLEVYVVADCVSSRNPSDKLYALERMRSCGIHIVTREMVAFEWMQKSGTETFKRISKEYLR